MAVEATGEIGYTEGTSLIFLGLRPERRVMMMQGKTGVAIIGAMAERTARAAAMALEGCTREYAELMFEADKMSDLLLIEQVIDESLTLDTDIAREYYDAVLRIYLPCDFSV